MNAPHTTSPVIAISFKYKLMIAMLVIVLAISVSTLYVTRNKVDAVYRDFLSEQFEDQFDLFFEKQEARLASAKEAIGDAVRNVRLIAALDAGNLDRFYSDLGFELNEIFERYHLLLENENNPASPFFRYINADGKMTVPSDSSAGYIKGMDEGALSTTLEQLSSGFHPEMGDEVGCLILGGMGVEGLYEIIVTQLFDPFTDDFHGDLIFGVPQASMPALTGKSTEGLKNGLFLSGSVYSDSITEDVYKHMEQIIGRDLSGTSDITPKIEIDGTPHLLFHQSLSTESRFPDVHHFTLFSLAELQTLIDQLRRSIFGFASLAVIGAVLLSFIASHQMTRPILDLVKGTEEIQKGNFDVNLPIRSRDEIGMLTGSFNSMSTDLALKEKYRSVLDKVTDREVADELMNGTVELGGELRDITVLFCDIRGFTRLTSGMSPSEVINMLNEHMTAMTNVVYKHHGVVDKYIGDEIMVIFGAPRSYGADTFNAAQCALMMVEERKRLNHSGRYNFNIGIGLSSGEVVAGCMGSDDRLNYTVLGGQVNLTSRLCSVATPMEVLLDSATGDSLQGRSEIEPKENLNLKGISETMTAYRLLSIDAS